MALGYGFYDEGVCGGRDTYHQTTLTLEECKEKCTSQAECSAISFKEGHGGCGTHTGAIQFIPNSNSGVWPAGYSCYEKQCKISFNFIVIRLTI